MASSNANSAWLKSDDRIFLVAVPADSGRSAIVELIERVYHAESLLPKSRARSILRERIYANYPATIAERETVKVAAKRLDSPTDFPVPMNVISLPEAPALPDFRKGSGVGSLRTGAPLARGEVAAWLERLKSETAFAREKWASARPISAILVDRDHRVVSFAWNTNETIRTRHAERNLCESLAGGPTEGRIPEGATLYVSLKPCRMCAARIWDAAVDPTKLTVVYLENDPGPFAQGTMLEARSPARLRYLGPNHPLFGASVERFGMPVDEA